MSIKPRRDLQVVGAALTVALLCLLASVNDVGAADQIGKATYCAPTPKYCQSWGGGALVGAVKSFSWGDKPYKVRVTNLDNGASVIVTVVSYCACGNRQGVPTVIDLSPAAFKRLAPLHIGVIKRVSVQRVGGGPSSTLPPTDTKLVSGWSRLFSVPL